MEDNRAEQIEALETFLEFNERIVKNIGIIIKELKGARLDDTDKFLESIVNAINWEVEVMNGTMKVLNEGKQRINKEAVNQKILALSDALKSKEDSKIAEAFQNLLPELEAAGKVAREVIG